MPKAKPSMIRQFLHRVAEDQRGQELSDQELLERFTTHRDEAAFDMLLRRHGPMVLGTCRAFLPSEADAEDAFQATFLVLARKAMAIQRSASLASWLHGVAYRTARKAQAELARRQKHERRASHSEVAPPEDWTWREVQQALHEELCGMSECYQAPLTLCYLQGMTQDEAAVHLGIARSTLKVRLERGRQLLRARLVRRGLGPAAILLASAWPVSGMAGLPSSAVVSTINAVLRVAAGEPIAGLVSAQVAAWTERALRAMLLTKQKTVLTAMTLLALVGLGLGGLAYSTRAEERGEQEELLARAPVAPSAEQVAAAALQAVGGRIITDRTLPGAPVVGVYLLSHQVTDGDLKYLKAFSHLKVLILPGITDTSIKELRGLKTLEHLRARSSTTEGPLRELGELTELRELELEGLEEGALEDLQGLTKLRVLKLTPWRATGSGWKALASLKKLRRLELSYVFRTPTEESNVTQALKDLRELPHLEELRFREGCVDDEAMKQVARLPALRVLELKNNGRVTDKGLAELKALPNLRRLVLRNVRKTSAEGIADLKKALPHLEVAGDDPEAPRRTWQDFERISGKAKVIDAKTLLFEDGTRVPLLIRAPGPRERGGKEAAELLARLIGDQTVSCYLVEAQLAWVGYVGEVNIEHTMIINGWARSHHSGTAPAETIARENKRGLWGNKINWPGR
jgi:RNA polymerase sigma factor (sigma-70 family)